MDLFEYQGKQYLAAFGVPVAEGKLATDPDQVSKICGDVGFPAVLKAQVKVGGRGKSGGILIVDTPQGARSCAAEMLGGTVKGHVVRSVWVEPAAQIAREYYVSLSVDRASGQYLLLASGQGGVEIEELAIDDPLAIQRLYVDPTKGISPSEASALGSAAGIDVNVLDEFTTTVLAMYRCLVDGDAELVEINPLIVDSQGAMVALDAKITLDDSAAFRHPEWADFEDTEGGDARELLARRHGLNYVGLTGEVGIVANGAGLAMATLDVVATAGGRAANFLDIGGGASAAVMAAALEVIGSDPAVRSVFVNVFGGITRCDEVAKGIVEAVSAAGIALPIVLRLEGTNAAQGRSIIEECDCDTIFYSATMQGAAELAVELSKARLP